MIHTAISPGKLIFSGEHAVIYGEPAIVGAIARYTTVRFKPIHRSNTLKTVLKGMTAGRNFPLQALNRLHDMLDERFERFRHGDLAVKNILQRPDDLVLYTLAQLARQFPVPGRSAQHGLPTPGHLQTESDLPLGAGMGSSAAVIAATMVLYEHLLNKPLSLKARFQRIRFCERLQHGKGSAIDATAVTYGGVHYLENEIPQPINTNLSNWYWILSGIPESSTGECLTYVRQHFAKDSVLWRTFGHCTRSLHNCLQSKRPPNDVLRENHRLLKRIGVVTSASDKLISDIEAHGGYAKVSGAGSIRGQHSGVIIVWHAEPEALSRFLNDHYANLSWGAVDIASQGSHLQASA